VTAEYHKDDEQRRGQIGILPDSGQASRFAPEAAERYAESAMQQSPRAGKPQASNVNSLDGWEFLEDAADINTVLAGLGACRRLPVYSCAELYDLAYPGYPGDGNFYLEKAGSGRVLYLGIGTGRIFAPLAKRNSDAVGLDSSPDMIARLRKRFPHINDQQIMHADAANADLPAGHFDTIVAPYSFLQAIEPERVPRVLENVCRWLVPGGKFYTDTFSPYLIPFRRRGLETNQRQLGKNAHVTIYVRYNHLGRSMTELAHVVTPKDECVLEMHLYYYFPHEITAALRQAGFPYVQIDGSYAGELLDPAESEVIVYEARTAAK
jgi:SAM-dependent methyltransferase